MLEAGAAVSCPATAQTKAIEKIDRMAEYPHEENRVDNERNEKHNTDERNKVQVFILYAF